MNFLVEKALRESKSGLFTLSEAMAWSPYAHGSLLNALANAVGSGDIVRIRRGLYALSRDLTPVLPHPYAVANLAYGPSYVSLETALEFHGWIPEAVNSVFCVTSARGRRFATPFGLMRYVTVKQFPLMLGVERHDEHPSGTFFVASPLKALCDLVVTRHLDWTGCEPLCESLRIEEESLATLCRRDFDLLTDIYYSQRARRFLAGLRRELGK